MINPLGLVPSRYRWIAYAALAALVAGAGAWTGHKATRAWYAPKLARAESARDEFQAAYLHLAGVVQIQNDAITTWETEAGNAFSRAVKAREEADRYRRLADRRAAALYALKPTKDSEDECDALRALVDLDRAPGWLSGTSAPDRSGRGQGAGAGAMPQSLRSAHAPDSVRAGRR